MAAPQIEVKVSASPYAFASREAYGVAALEMKSSDQGTLIVHENFLKYLEELVPSDDERKTILQSLLGYHLEKYKMQTDKSHPLHGQPAAFEEYCKVKYKKLFSYVERMVDRVISERE